MFLEQQISILEWFLRDHVTLKTENSTLGGIKYTYITECKEKLDALSPADFKLISQ